MINNNMRKRTVEDITIREFKEMCKHFHNPVTDEKINKLFDTVFACMENCEPEELEELLSK